MFLKKRTNTILARHCQNKNQVKGAGRLFICLFGVFRPTREFFTHFGTSPLPVKGCKCLLMLGTFGH